jgi:hypothetical protein
MTPWCSPIAQTANFGSSATLNTDASPIIRSYLKFNVSSLDGPVASATLRIFRNSGSAGV